MPSRHQRGSKWLLHALQRSVESVLQRRGRNTTAKTVDGQAATLLVHKPAGLDCHASSFWAQLRRDADDALHGRPALPGLFMGQRCVAALAPEESGLVVFTQVTGVARRLHDDAPLVEHEFSIDVAGAVDVAVLQQLRPARASINRQSPERTGLRVGPADAGALLIRA